MPGRFSSIRFAAYQLRFFASYKPAGGTLDQTWKDKREGQRFHQISIAGLPPNSPQMYLASLIRSQIDAYGADKTNVRYFNKNTANEADLVKVAASLELVSTAFRSSVGTIRLPLVTDKPPEFQKLTTVGLLSLRPGSL